VRFRVRFRDDTRAPAADDGVILVVQRAGQDTHRVRLRRRADQSNRGVFDGALPAAPVGKYHAWIAEPASLGGSHSVDFTVEAPPGETAVRPVNSESLEAVAGVTEANRYYTFENAHRLIDDLPDGQQVVIERMAPFSLWNWPPVVALLLGLLTTEWILRKRRGLL